jgi:anti-anti-sigma regulatory factor
MAEGLEVLLFMLRISQSGMATHSVALTLEGRVVGPWVGELCRVCETLLSQGRALVLDLAGVTFADASGVSALASFASRGVSLTNCSPFVQEQLKSPMPD